MVKYWKCFPNHWQFCHVDKRFYLQISAVCVDLSNLKNQKGCGGGVGIPHPTVFVLELKIAFHLQISSVWVNKSKKSGGGGGGGSFRCLQFCKNAQPGSWSLFPVVCAKVRRWQRRDCERMEDQVPWRRRRSDFFLYYEFCVLTPVVYALFTWLFGDTLFPWLFGGVFHILD